jgi:isoleucyl-tRNA synthetase
MRFHAERCLRLAANRSVSHSLKRRNYSHKPVDSADAKTADYSATLLLPKHDIPFPSRWNGLPANVKNSTVLQKCVGVYKWQVIPVPILKLRAQSDNLTGEPFILHDGPPYANGDLHLGLLLLKRGD